MLSRLYISNFALIEEVEVEFTPGLTVITGETGAGKSIMLSALSLLLGNRAGSSMVGDKKNKAVVEATFTGVGPDTVNSVKAIAPDTDCDEIIIRREQSQSGRSRAFVNDTPVTLSVLADITTRLIDIHSQHNTLSINNPHKQLGFIDAIAGYGTLLDEYRDIFTRFVNLKLRIAKLREEISRSHENRDFIEFQLEQLDKLKPKTGELAEIERRFDLLSDAGDIKEKLSSATSLLTDADTGILDSVSSVRGLLSRVDFTLLSNTHENTAAIQQRLEAIYVELKDIAATVESHASSVEADPATLDKLSLRMNALYDATKRFKVSHADELPALRERLKKQLSAIDGDDSVIAPLENELRQLAPILKNAADRLSDARIAAAEVFDRTLNELARPLGLPNLRFSTLISKGKLTASGQDSAVFLCAFNKNQELSPLSDVASGGELSRVMLCIKAIVAKHAKMPTLIFDEIDTGVSGDIADRMGAMMKQMGNDMQVLAITHLPQVAAKGNTHYKVFKTDNEFRTVTGIKRLDTDNRVTELAVMLSGSDIDDAAIENARSLLAKAAEIK